MTKDFWDYLREKGAWDQTELLPAPKSEKEALRAMYLKGLVHALSFCEQENPPGTFVKEGFVLKALPHINRLASLK